MGADLLSDYGNTGGGIYNIDSGVFNMNGDTISGNETGNDGGIANSGKFTMTGGEITGNNSGGGWTSNGDGTHTRSRNR